MMQTSLLSSLPFRSRLVGYSDEQQLVDRLMFLPKLWKSHAGKIIASSPTAYVMSMLSSRATLPTGDRMDEDMTDLLGDPPLEKW